MGARRRGSPQIPSSQSSFNVHVLHLVLGFRPETHLLPHPPRSSCIDAIAYRLEGLLTDLVGPQKRPGPPCAFNRS